MPVYDLTYRAFDGEAKRRGRWLVIVAQELRVMIRLRPLMYLILLPAFHVCLRVLLLVTYDMLMANPNNPLALAARNASIMNVNARTFYDFLRIQGVFVFLIILLAGSGMICNDSRHNLLDIYFSKPLTWRDYVMGKAATLIGLGLALTAVPGVFLVFLHNLLAPSLKTLEQSWWWLFAIIGFSLAYVLPAAFGVLAFSAGFKSERYASLAVAMVVVIDVILVNILAEMLVNRSLLILSIPTAINRIGEVLFEVRRPAFDLPWQTAACVVAAVCLVCLWVVVRKARRAEVAA